MDSSTYTATVHNMVAEACRGTGTQADCMFASWTQQADRGPGWLDVELCGHTRNTSRAADSTRTTHGTMQLCANDGTVRILCRPPATDWSLRSMRAATFDTPYSTLCSTEAPVCACTTQGIHDDTCNPLPCPAGCSGHGTCNTADMRCTCEEGYYGEDCASTCTNVSPTNGLVCSGHGVCGAPAQTGACQCDEGYAGTLCDQCAPGFYGPLTDCSQRCRVAAAKPDCGSDVQFEACGVCGGTFSYWWYDPDLDASLYHEDEERGHCDPTVGCVCRPGSLLDPRTGCSTCLPGSDWRRDINGRTWQMQCVARGLCRTPKTALLGLADDVNGFCRVEDFQFATSWCDTDAGDESPPPCAPRADIAPCNGHGTCVSNLNAGNSEAVLPFRTPTLGVFGKKCVAALTTTGAVMFVAWPGDPGATCGAVEGLRSAGHFTGNPEDTFVQLLRVDRYAVAVTHTGRVWTIYNMYSTGMQPFQWDVDYDGFANAGEAFVGLAGSVGYAFAVFGHSVVKMDADASGATQVVATIPSHMDPMYVIGSQYYLAVATRSGDWWYLYSAGEPWSTTTCCSFDDAVPTLLPASSFGGGTRAPYVGFDGHQPYALTTGGAVRKWDAATRGWTKLINFDGDIYASLLQRNGGRFQWRSTAPDTREIVLPGLPAITVPPGRSVVELDDNMGYVGAALLDDGKLWTWGDDAVVYSYDMEASTTAQPMGTQPMVDRFYQAATSLAGDQSTRESDLLGSLVVVADPSASLVVGRACVCDSGWTGEHCTVEMRCTDDSGTGAACTSGLVPGPRTNPTLSMVLAPAGTQLVPQEDSVPPIRTPPSREARIANTRIFVLRQREVDLDPFASRYSVLGVTEVHARRYTPARAEYLCYRAHRSGRLITELDLDTLRPQDLQTLTRELDAPTGRPVPSDGLFWVRGDGTTHGWSYAAFDRSLQVLRQYNDQEPTVVANVVCAFDHDALLAAAPSLDVFHRCKLPSWFCSLWKPVAGLDYCDWLGN